jgi:uncharacterized protein (TIGR02217 family)
MSFMESPRFPDNIARGVSFGPTFSTSIAQTVGGQEYRNKNRTRGLCVGDCSHSIKTLEQHQELLKFFRSVAGRFVGFRFKDWSDYKCLPTEGVTTLVSGTTYQLNKLYQIAVGYNEIRKITKPVSGTIIIYRTRSSVTTNITGTSTINHTTGQVTVTSHQAGDTYNWEGQFDVPCRFDTDSMPVIMTHHEVFTWQQIPIVELLL